jgi:hypothetical protein
VYLLVDNEAPLRAQLLRVKIAGEMRLYLLVKGGTAPITSSLVLTPGLRLFVLDPGPTLTFGLAAVQRCEVRLQVLDVPATVTP